MARVKQTDKGRTWSSVVPPALNKSGIFIGGSTGSGTAKAVKKPKPVSLLIRKVRGTRSAGLTGPSGSGSPKAEWVGKGANKHYADVPEANKDRGKVSVPKSRTQQKRDEATAGVNMGGARQTGSRVSSSVSAGTGSAGRVGVGGTTASPAATPAKRDESGGKPKRNTPAPSDSTSTSSQNSGSKAAPADSGKKGKELPAPGTLNYFMRRAALVGDKNVYGRGYQLWKNYKKAIANGEKPGLPPLNEGKRKNNSSAG